MKTKISALLLAAGSGQRMQSVVADKILAPLCGGSVFTHAVQAFLDAGIFDSLTIVYRDASQRDALAQALATLDLKDHPVHWVAGGQERQDSVYNALQAQPQDCSHVFIHDCARPLIQSSAILKLWDAAQRDGAAVLAHPPVDTIKRIATPNELQQCALEDLERERLWAMETPQAFAYPEILKAYTHVREHQLKITDDTAAAAIIGLKTTLVQNNTPNPKITSPADLHYAEWLLATRRDAPVER